MGTSSTNTVQTTEMQFTLSHSHASLAVCLSRFSRLSVFQRLSAFHFLSFQPFISHPFISAVHFNFFHFILGIRLFSLSPFIPEDASLSLPFTLLPHLSFQPSPFTPQLSLSGSAFHILLIRRVSLPPFHASGLSLPFISCDASPSASHLSLSPHLSCLSQLSRFPSQSLPFPSRVTPSASLTPSPFPFPESHHLHASPLPFPIHLPRGHTLRPFQSPHSRLLSLSTVNTQSPKTIKFTDPIS